MIFLHTKSLSDGNTMIHYLLTAFTFLLSCVLVIFGLVCLVELNISDLLQGLCHLRCIYYLNPAS